MRPVPFNNVPDVAVEKVIVHMHPSLKVLWKDFLTVECQEPCLSIIKQLLQFEVGEKLSTLATARQNLVGRFAGGQ